MPARRHRFRKTALSLVAMSLVLQGCGGSDDDTVATPPPATLAKRPNIVFIMADDLGYSDVGAFG
ncbi:MAG: hypothetical protein ABW067_16750, partial [Rhizobacter sp.]